jgi:hypothetical protein
VKRSSCKDNEKEGGVMTFLGLGINSGIDYLDAILFLRIDEFKTFVLEFPVASVTSWKCIFLKG